MKLKIIQARIEIFRRPVLQWSPIGHCGFEAHISAEKIHIPIQLELTSARHSSRAMDIDDVRLHELLLEHATLQATLIANLRQSANISRFVQINDGPYSSHFTQQAVSMQVNF
ncbi:hypothetical protein [Streptomyces sp. NPDC006879]|uniref:hypothetical protein n=1 Tax=Streptomyces sp. NPDC006879 TaxID=3364767 RepID=UPI0036A6D196